MALNREKVIRSAEKYVSKGKLEHAINEYRKVLKENPNDANTLNRVGDLYARIEKIDEAVKLFTQIAEQYTRDGFFVKAIAIYKKIIKLDPTVLQVYERLAELYHKQGLLNEARTQFQVLADYYQKHDNATSATTIYQRMVEMEPDNPSYHLKLAELYQGQKLDDKAVASYRQLADLLLVNGSVEEASQVYLRALEVGHDDLVFVRDAVSSLHDGGHSGPAARVLARAVELNPEAASIEREIGMAGPEPVLEEEPPTPDPMEAVGSPPGDDGAFEIDADDAFDVDLDDGAFDFDEAALDDAAPPGREGPVEVAAARAALDDDTLDEDESVEFDIGGLDDDDGSASMVRPADMDATGTGSAFLRTDDEDDFEVDWGTGEAELEIELDGDDEGPAPVEIELEPPTGDFEIELDLSDAGVDQPAAVQETAPEPTPEPEEVAGSVHRPEDLLDEARVFAKYGLKDKARDRVATLLADWPDHPGGLRLRLEMALDEQDEDTAWDLGSRLADVVRDGADPADWQEARLALEAAGYTVSADRLLGRPGEVVEAVDIGPEPVLDAPEVEFPTPTSEPGVEDAGDPDFELEANEPEFDFEPEIELEADVSVELEPSLPEPAAEPLTPEVPDSSPPPVEAPEPPAVETPAAETPAAESTAAATTPVRSTGAATPVESGSRKRKDRINRLLEDLDLDALGVSRPRRKTPAPAPPPPSVSVPPEPAAPEALADSPPAPPEESPAVEAPPPFPAAPAAPAGPPERRKVSLVDELGLDELDDELGGVFEDAKARATGSTESVVAGSEAEAASGDDLDETGMSWLDEPAPSPDAGAVGAGDSLFDAEDDFFDLASELEKELSEDELTDEPEIVQNQEQSLEEIIDGFKKGVAENLSPEDFDTHFNLGIAYREMGLVDEAIGEFQLSSKDERYLVDSSSMLGMCFLEKGLPELALRWYRKGLESPTIEEGKTLGLLYEMGNTYVSMGDEQAAYKTFAEIYGIDSGFRDVQSRMEELRPVTQ